MTSPVVGRSSEEVPSSQSLPEMVVPAYTPQRSVS